MRSIKIMVLIAVTTGILNGCAPPVVKTLVLVPPRYSEVADLRRIAVLPFSRSRRDVEDVTADVEAALASVRVDDRPYFKVIERTQLKKIIDEQRLGSTGLLDQRTAVKVGKIAGVQGVILGKVSQSDVSSRRFKRQVKRCVSKNSNGKCQKWRAVNVRCLARTGTFGFVPKIVDVSTGRIVMSETIEKQFESQECEGQAGPSDTDLLNRARSIALKSFMDSIAPHYMTEKLALLSKDEPPLPAHVKARVESGLAFAKAGRLDRACGIWHGAHDGYSNGYLLPYLIGVCHEARGELGQASHQYKIADQRTLEPVREINESLVRISNRISEAGQLEHQTASHSSDIKVSDRPTLRAQQALDGLGYNPGPVDGMMGSSTRSAIREYQSDNGIEPTGKLDTATKESLGIK